MQPKKVAHAQEQVEFDHNHKSQQLLNAATSVIVPFDEELLYARHRRPLALTTDICACE